MTQGALVGYNCLWWVGLFSTAQNLFCTMQLAKRPTPLYCVKVRCVLIFLRVSWLFAIPLLLHGGLLLTCHLFRSVSNIYQTEELGRWVMGTVPFTVVTL